MCTPSSGAVSPRRVPQIPLESSSIIAKKSQKKSMRSSIPTAPTKSSSRKGKKSTFNKNKPPVSVKGSEQSSIQRPKKSPTSLSSKLPSPKSAQKPKQTAVTVSCRPLQPLDVVDCMLEECVLTSPVSLASFSHSTKKSQNGFHEAALDTAQASPQTPPAPDGMEWSQLSARRARGHDSASSSKWSDSGHPEKVMHKTNQTP